MSLTYAERIAQAAEQIAADDSMGYSQPNRSGWGGKVIHYTDGSTYTIPGGDTDCSEMVRRCVNAGLGREEIEYMWTGNERAELAALGFRQVRLDRKRRGDILWKTGHTGVYLGDGLMADAQVDEVGGIDGPQGGDQTGREIAVRRAASLPWEECWRPPVGTVDDAPVEPAQGPWDISRGIDISNWQGGGFNGDETAAGFVIVKASEGVGWADSFAAGFLGAALAAGKLVGVYHFARDNDARAEAEWFVDCARATGHLDAVTMWLDYEADALGNGPAWCEEFMARVDELTGKTCGLYTSQAVTVEQDFAASARRPLWVAQYASDDPVHGWQDDPWTTRDYGAWDRCAILQYTGSGFVDGCGPLDLDRGYFTAAEWAAWATGTEYEPQPQPEPAPEPDERGWDEMAPRTFRFATAVNVRTAPSTSAQVVAVYQRGQTVVLDGLAYGDGFVWGHYVGAQSGEDRYVALGPVSYVGEV